MSNDEILCYIYAFIYDGFESDCWDTDSHCDSLPYSYIYDHMIMKFIGLEGAKWSLFDHIRCKVVAV